MAMPVILDLRAPRAQDSSVGATRWMALQWGQKTLGLLEGLHASRALAREAVTIRGFRRRESRGTAAGTTFSPLSAYYERQHRKR